MPEDRNGDWEEPMSDGFHEDLGSIQDVGELLPGHDEPDPASEEHKIVPRKDKKNSTMSSG